MTTDSIACSLHRNEDPSPRLQLHADIGSALREQRYSAGVAPLARLILSVPHGHPALAGLWLTMAFLQCELSQWVRAEAAARYAVALAPESLLARGLLERAIRHGGSPCR